MHTELHGLFRNRSLSVFICVRKRSGFIRVLLRNGGAFLEVAYDLHWSQIPSRTTRFSRIVNLLFNASDTSRVS